MQSHQEAISPYGYLTESDAHTGAPKGRCLTASAPHSQTLEATEMPISHGRNTEPAPGAGGVTGQGVQLSLVAEIPRQAYAFLYVFPNVPKSKNSFYKTKHTHTQKKKNLRERKAENKGRRSKVSDCGEQVLYSSESFTFHFYWNASF